MALNSLGLGFVFTARDAASGVMNKVRGNFAKTASSTQKNSAIMKGAFGAIGGGLVALTAGLAGVGVAMAAANSFAEFEQGMAKVEAISGASAEEMGRLSQAAIQAGIDTQFSPTEASEGLANLASQGLNATESIELLSPALALASAGQISIADASSATAAAMKVFGLDTEDAALAVDKLVKATTTSAIKGSELSLALGTVARGAGLTDQSLTEMVTTMGLVRGTGVDISVAASGVSSALLMLSKNADEFKKIGVKVTDDATGDFRDLGDIILDTSEALGTKYTNQAQKAAAAQQLFGRFGVAAYVGINKQLDKGVKTSTQGLLKGKEALNFLRNASEGAKGSAERMQDTLLDTMEGQKTLLKGTLQTLSVVSGEAFASAFKPIISAITTALNFLIKIISKTPGPVKKLLAVVLLIGSTFLAAGGGTLLFVGAVLLLLPALKVMAVVAGIAAVAMLTLIAVMALAAIGISGFVVAFREDVGGLATDTGDLLGKIKLGFDALGQLFSQGGFSGKVREEMNKASNQGLRNFAIQVFLVANRVKNFMKGMGEGFVSGVKAAKPAIESLKSAITNLGKSLGFLGDKADAGDAKGKFKSWGEAGEEVGKVLSSVFVFIVETITGVVKALTGMAKVWGTMGKVGAVFGTIFSVIGGQLNRLGTSLGLTTNKTGEASSGWELFGNVVAAVVINVVAVVGILLTVFSVVFSAIVVIIGVFKAILLTVAGIVMGVVEIVTAAFSGGWAQAWNGAKRIAVSVVAGIVQVVGALVQGIADMIDGIAALFGKDLGLANMVKDSFVGEKNVNVFRKKFVTDFEVGKEPDPGIGFGAGGDLSTQPESNASFAPSTAQAAANQRSAQVMADAVSAALASKSKSGAATNVTVNSTITLDEEVLGTAIKKIQAADSANTFGAGSSTID